MKYDALVEIYEQLENTSKRLEKTFIISKFLKKIKENDLNEVVLLIKGRVFPQWDESKIGVASRLVLKSINTATGTSIEKIEDEWKKTGDLGLVAEHLTKSKSQATLFSSDLTVKKVFENIKSLTKTTGAGAVDRKVKLIAELLTSAKPKEAKYIIRTVLEDLRVGVGDGSLRDAIVWAYFGDKLKLKYNKEKNDLEISDEERQTYNKYVEAVQEAYDLKNDFAEVAEIAKKGKLESLQGVSLEVGKPIKVMLYQKAENMEDAFERVGSPAAIEYKYDGFRLQIHRNKDEIKLFTRRLENVTKQFPDVVKIVKDNIKSKNYILDTEVIGIDPKTKQWLPFQNVSQRIKRKHHIEQTIKEIPIMVNIFDLISLNDESTLKLPFKERRAKLNKITDEVKGKLQLAKQIITSSIKEAEEFYQEALSKGNEGIMMKKLDAPYKPGSRVGYGVKVKPVMETLDLVITAADWGEGKRAAWLSSFTIACKKGDQILEIGKVGTGFKEKEEEGKEGVSFNQMTKLLKPLIIEEKGKHIKVKPKIVIELNYEEIQKSVNYNSGFALRFPRIVRLRPDKPVSEISTINQVKRFFETQKARKS